MSSLVSLAVIVVAIALVCMVPESPSQTLRNQLFCYRTIAPFRHVEYFPLPLPVSHSAHEVVLDELRYPEDILSSLIDQYTEVCSSLTPTSEELVKFLAHAVAMYVCSDSNHARTSFRNEINTTHKQLNSTVTEVQTLARLYHKIRQDYHTLHSSYSAHVFPLKEDRRQEEKIRLGVVAMERELQRSERILRVVEELENNFLVLATLVGVWDTKVENDSKNTLHVLIKDLCQHIWDRILPRYIRHDITQPRRWDCVWRQQELQKWLRFFHQEFKEHWNELLASVNEGEEKLVINITPEWCERQDTSQQ